MKNEILNAMKNATSKSTLDNLDTAAELLHIEGVISLNDYDEIHRFWRNHWYDSHSGKVERLD